MLSIYYHETGGPGNIRSTGVFSAGPDPVRKTPGRDRLRIPHQGGMVSSVQISRDAILSQRVLSKEQVRPPAGLPRFSRDFTTRKIGRAHRPPTGLCLVKKLKEK